MNYLFLCFALTFIGFTFAETCNHENEKYTDCGTACPETCANMNDPKKPCIDLCVKGCFCEPGFVRDANNTCVLKKNCLQSMCIKLNEIYHNCGTSCPITCTNYQNPPSVCVSMVCKEGCFCQPPYIRDSSTGKCVLPSDCTVILTTEATG